MKKHGIIVVTLLLALLFLFTGCPPDPGDPTNTDDDVAAAADAVDEANTALENEDWETALSKFSEAVTLDPTNGEALLGYALLETMSITTEDDMVTLATSRLGIVDYPDSMNTLFSEDWLETVTVDEGDGPFDFTAPEISGQEDFDGDGVIGPLDKNMSAMKYFATHNTTGFNELVTSLGSVIEDRLDAALLAIDAVPDDAQITFPNSITDLNDTSGDPIDLVVGKAEAQALAAYLQAFRSQIHMALVYDYTLPLEGFWNWSQDVGSLSDLDTPFAAGFLSASAEADDELAAAKADMLGAIDLAKAAITGILSRSSSSPYSMDASGDFMPTTTWDEYETTLNFSQRHLEEIEGSINDSVPAYFPVPLEWTDPYVEMDNYVDSWPTAADVENGIFSFNYGILYGSPIFAISSILDLDADGEPNFYKWDGNGGFVAATDVPAMDGSDYFYYMKIEDISFGGAVDTSIIPMEDPTADRYSVEESSFTFTDDWIVNGTWDSGEAVTNIDITSSTTGAIDIADYTTVDPAEFYWGPVVLADIPDTELVGISGAGNEDALRSAISAYDPDLVPGIDSPVAVMDGTEVYMALPTDAHLFILHSLTTAGDDLGADYDGDSENDISTGSFWWGLVDMFM